MKVTLPSWLNPWAEVRRLRAAVTKQEALVEKAVHSLWEVQSCAARELRTLRIELGRARYEADQWREKVMEVASLVPPAPAVLHIVGKEDDCG